MSINAVSTFVRLIKAASLAHRDLSPLLEACRIKKWNDMVVDSSTSVRLVGDLSNSNLVPDSTDARATLTYQQEKDR